MNNYKKVSIDTFKHQIDKHTIINNNPPKKLFYWNVKIVDYTTTPLSINMVMCSVDAEKVESELSDYVIYNEATEVRIIPNLIHKDSLIKTNIYGN